MRPPDDMPEPWLQGWKDICEFMDASEKTCRAWAERTVDPLPIDDDGFGHPLAKGSALRDWIGRQRMPWSRARCLPRRPDGSRVFPLRLSK
jgi:hypothetical protein